MWFGSFIWRAKPCKRFRCVAWSDDQLTVGMLDRVKFGWAAHLRHSCCIAWTNRGLIQRNKYRPKSLSQLLSSNNDRKLDFGGSPGSVSRSNDIKFDFGGSFRSVPQSNDRRLDFGGSGRLRLGSGGGGLDFGVSECFRSDVDDNNIGFSGSKRFGPGDDDSGLDFLRGFECFRPDGDDNSWDVNAIGVEFTDPSTCKAVDALASSCSEWSFPEALSLSIS